MGTRDIYSASRERSAKAMHARKNVEGRRDYSRITLCRARGNIIFPALFTRPRRDARAPGESRPTSPGNLDFTPELNIRPRS